MKALNHRLKLTYGALAAISALAFTPEANTAQADALRCPEIAKICSNGQPATYKSGTCEQVCGDDPISGMHAGQHGACQAIRGVCKSAGYKAGGAFDNDGNPDNGLGRDCMSDLLLDRTVAGVTLNQDQQALLAQCKQLPHPCLQVVDACDAAHAPKGCVKNVAMGKSVQGVVAPASDKVMACAQHLLRREIRQDQNHTSASPPAAPAFRGGAESAKGL